MKRNEITSAFGRGDVLNTGRADLGVVPQRILDATLGAGAVRWPTSRILEEVGKQAIDQPGHFLIGAAPIWASRYLVGGAVVRLDRRTDPCVSGMAAMALAPLVGSAARLGLPDAWRRRGNPGPPGLASLLRSRSQPSGNAWRRDPSSAAGCLSAHEERTRRRSGAQCSSNSRMPPITSRMPMTSVRFGRSWKKKTAAAKVNTSSIWPSART